mmetsp:Transcript_61720/g.169622  ORF Transcript_61720/g.169622 Transcript_61720/m.169622 type:complete len:109 (+) Transcript_61720:549-875(+)|eukprot:1905539-Prymnesium_polylepis.3
MRYRSCSSPGHSSMKWDGGLGERLVGKRYLCGGEIQYIDLQSGEEVHVPDDAHGQVSVTLSPPSFCVMCREAVMAGRKYDDYMVEEPHLEWWVQPSMNSIRLFAPRRT